jgi:hypothetical protein
MTHDEALVRAGVICKAKGVKSATGVATLAEVLMTGGKDADLAAVRAAKIVGAKFPLGTAGDVAATAHYLLNEPRKKK